MSEVNSISQEYPCLNPDESEKKWRIFIRRWLYCILVMCLAIVMIGGATRMTGSGLSITEWKPVHGIIPPLGENEWHEEFEKYKQIAQYQFVNKGMDLASFKSIYWWEWSHRFLARMIGLVASIPLFYLIFQAVFTLLKSPCNFFRKLPFFLKQPLLKIAVLAPLLIGIQGVIGWWMVSSGIGKSQLISVSQYRLAIHLVTACIIIFAITYLARSFTSYSAPAAKPCVSFVAGSLVFFILLQIYFGALVAGSHAGLAYNTWPLMEGKIIPSGLFVLTPWWINFFENILTIQFIHRIAAYFVFILALSHLLQLKQVEPETPHAHRSVILFIMVSIQAFFGIITLLTHVPIAWGIIHQFFALLVLIFATAHWRATKEVSYIDLKPFHFKS